jgi:flagellar basal-body rod modification protein FlgD
MIKLGNRKLWKAEGIMSVSSIGGAVGSGSDGSVSTQGLSIQDFLQLFLSQLTFQDPLQPVDNTQFLAQLAEFTNIEQTQVISDNISGLLTLESNNQAISLIGHTVEATANNTTLTGTVTTVSLANGATTLTLSQTDGTPVEGLSLSQVTLVR